MHCFQSGLWDARDITLPYGCEWIASVAAEERTEASSVLTSYGRESKPQFDNNPSFAGAV